MLSGNPTLRRVLAAFAVLVVLVSACSDDDGSATVEDTTGGGDDATTTTAPVDTVPVDGEASTTTGAGGDENTASFRGVTEDTITVGITVPDFEALQAAGLPNYQGDNRIAYQVFIDRLNEAGGIHGRLLEPVYVDFDLLDPATQDAACVELTEDRQVFIVLYGLLADNNLCLTELHQTMVMTHAYQSLMARERSGDTVWLQLEPADDEKARILGEVIAEAGYLDGANIGILASTTTGGEAAGVALQETLAGKGYESTVHVAADTGGDGAARDAEVRRLAERMSADGVDFLFNLGGGGTWTEDFAESGFRPDRTAYIVLNTGTEASSDLSLLDGALTVAYPSADDVWNDPAFRAECIDPILAAHPELTEEFADLPDADRQAQGERNWLTPTRNACNHVMLLEELGEIAGADLTNDSFRAALDALGPVELFGYGTANFTSEGKWDGLDEFFLQEYHSDTESLDVIGDPIVVDR